MTIYTLYLCIPNGEPIKIDRIGEILFENGFVKFRFLTESGVLDYNYCYFPPVSNFFFQVNFVEDQDE